MDFIELSTKELLNQIDQFIDKYNDDTELVNLLESFKHQINYPPKNTISSLINRIKLYLGEEQSLDIISLIRSYSYMYDITIINSDSITQNIIDNSVNEDWLSIEVEYRSLLKIRYSIYNDYKYLVIIDNTNILNQRTYLLSNKSIEQF